ASDEVWARRQRRLRPVEPEGGSPWTRGCRHKFAHSGQSACARASRPVPSLLAVPQPAARNPGPRLPRGSGSHISLRKEHMSIFDADPRDTTTSSKPSFQKRRGSSKKPLPPLELPELHAHGEHAKPAFRPKPKRRRS